MPDYEAVIGLETHIQLNTTTKIFCSCKADSWFDPPNTNICPVCTGMPGVLPVLNEAVVEKAVLLAAAMHAAIQPVSYFDRKNYFYPDLPKGYQISQYDRPIGRGRLPGSAHAGCADRPAYTRHISITKLHMEEDAGKTKNAGGVRLIDFNRCGVPLVEMVTGPDLRTADEAAQYLIAPAPVAALAGHLRGGYGKRPPALRRQRVHPSGRRRLPQPEDRDQERQLDRRRARGHRERDRAAGA